MLSAAAFLVLNGRVTGISGIVDGVLQPPSSRWLSGVLFLVGLVAGPVAFYLLFHDWPVVRVNGSAHLLAIAGLLVGFGTRLGGGRTPTRAKTAAGRSEVRS